MDRIAEIESYEERLRRAMLASDVAELERLISDASTFTNQDGVRLTKEDDLSTHRSGLLRIEKLDIVGKPMVRVLGDCAIVAVTADLAGRYAEHAFGGTFAYSRVWHRNGENWQIEAAHCSSVAS